MLYSGDGRHHGATLLTFSYDNPFHSFLRTLKDRTQQCVIPPLETSQPLPLVNKSSSQSPKDTSERITPESTVTAERIASESTVTVEGIALEPTVAVERIIPEFTLTAERITPESTLTVERVTPESTVTIEDVQKAAEQGDQHISWSPSSRTASLAIDNDTSSGDYTTLHDIDTITAPHKAKASSSDDNTNTRSYKDGGYTLDHGPWSYRIVDQKKPPSSRIWKRLATTDDYVEMLEAIRKGIAWGKEQTAAIVMHVSPYFRIMGLVIYC